MRNILKDCGNHLPLGLWLPPFAEAPSWVSAAGPIEMIDGCFIAAGLVPHPCSNVMRAPFKPQFSPLYSNDAKPKPEGVSLAAISTKSDLPWLTLVGSTR